jgi:UDP-4-amino-4,6-dideoxy-N-acetyl-beta-L-altrosamine N-acetyltransferase
MTSLVEFDERHLENTFGWISNPRVRSGFLLRRNIGYQEHLNWFEKYKSDPTQKIFAIVENGIHCGNCGFKFISDLDEKAELWIYLGNSSFEGRGVAKKALNVLIDFGFEKLKLNKMFLHVSESNERALKLYEKLGFHKEGFFKKEMKINNEYINIIRLCYFREEKL